MIEKVDLDGRVVPTINGFKEYENGGKGSGNFGHMGRPGKVGGSSSHGGVKSKGESGDSESKQKDYSEERRGVDARDGHAVGSDFADLAARLSTARTNLKVLERDTKSAYDDLYGRNRDLGRHSEMLRASGQAKALRQGKVSKETKALVKEMESELKSLADKYDKLVKKKYFDPDLNEHKD